VIPKTTCLVSSMRNEGRYILEFVAHYLLLGFDKIYVATNNNTDHTEQLLMALDRAGVVTCFAQDCAPGSNPQKSGYRAIFKHIRAHHPSPVLHIADADEFLMLYHDSDVRHFLSRFDDFDTIGFTWKFYGSGGHENPPPGIVMESYSHRVSDAHRGSRTIKSLTSDGPNLIGFGIHFPHFVDPTQARRIYSDGTTISNDWYLQPAETRGAHQAWVEVRTKLAAVHHYGLKSREEYANRRLRGLGDSFGTEKDRYTDTYFEMFDQNEVHDPVDPGWIAKVMLKMHDIAERASLLSEFSAEQLNLQSQDRLATI
jgi:hypothetical protein